MRLAPFLLETSEGRLETNSVFETDSSRLLVESITMTIDPMLMARRLEIPIGTPALRIRFLGRPVLSGSRLSIDLAGTNRSKGSLSVRSAEGVALQTATEREAVLNNFRTTIAFDKGVLTANGLQADFLRGTARGNVRLERRNSTPAFDLSLAVSDISMKEANDWLAPESRISDGGTFDLALGMRGGRGARSLSGTGRASIDADDPSAQNFVLVRGLVGALESVFPSLRRNGGWELDMPFTISDGAVRTDGARLKSRRVTATITGSVSLVDDRVDLLAVVNLRGLIGTIANVARPFQSGFVQVRATGTLQKIEWGRARAIDRNEAEARAPRNNSSAIRRRGLPSSRR